jgi:hypothetical protein
MIRINKYLFLFSISFLFLPDYLHSQQNDGETLYLKVDYFKAEGPQIAEYLDVEFNIWKELHRERYKRGIIKSWDFFSVVTGEPDTPYNYIAINLFDDFSLIDYFDLDDIIQTVYPDMDPIELMDRTRHSREVVRTEIWQVNGRVLDENQLTPGGNYITINYFDSRGGNGEHAEMELDFWGPIHKTRIDRGILNSWGMYSLLYPGGDARHYTYSTIDYYDNLGDLREPVGIPLAQIAHTDLSQSELTDYFNRTGESRTLYKTELWKRIGFVGPN